MITIRIDDELLLFLLVVIAGLVVCLGTTTMRLWQTCTEQNDEFQHLSNQTSKLQMDVLALTASARLVEASQRHNSEITEKLETRMNAADKKPWCFNKDTEITQKLEGCMNAADDDKKPCCVDKHADIKNMPIILDAIQESLRSLHTETRQMFWRQGPRLVDLLRRSGIERTAAPRPRDRWAFAPEENETAAQDEGELIEKAD